ncbi:hypothetical protein VPH184E373B_0242 [Vibrio phage 184E37-3b]|nr:hypothetical protein MYOV056v2_p0216 [Vibrio phage 184E37.3a]QZI90088.1 hypothetical protein MYOV057v1_p0173 [Vibrio phage 184E37.1]
MDEISAGTILVEGVGSFFLFLFIMLQACWPINDKSVPWYYPVNGLCFWLVIMYWVWG